jgi:hypothetical protein
MYKAGLVSIKVYFFLFPAVSFILKSLKSNEIKSYIIVKEFMCNFQDLESKHGGLLILVKDILAHGHGLELKIWLLCHQEQQLDFIKTWCI